jgi:hypothetical protein
MAHIGVGDTPQMEQNTICSQQDVDHKLNNNPSVESLAVENMHK